MLRNSLKYITLLFIGVVMAGCASLSTVDLNTPAKKLVYADAAFTAAVEEVVELHEVGLLTDQEILDLRPVIASGVTARSLAYKALDNGDPEAAIEYIETLQTVLLQLQQYLQEHQDG